MSMINVTKYKRLDGVGEAEQTANFLIWAAKVYPKDYIPYNLICKAVGDLPKAPSNNSETVARMKKRMSRTVRPILRDHHQRELVSFPRLGFRATVDALDTLKHRYAGSVRRVESAARGASVVAAIIDPSKLPKTTEGQQWRQYYERMNPQLAKITETATRAVLALPAGPNEEQDEKGEKKKAG